MAEPVLVLPYLDANVPREVPSKKSLSQSPCRLERIGRRADGADNSGHMCPRRDHGVDVRFVDPSDRADGDRDGGFYGTDGIGCCGTGVGLRDGLVKAADGDVIGAVLFGPARLVRVVDRGADDHLWADETPDDCYREVFLADMDAVGADGEREVNVVVQDERNAGFPADSGERFRDR